MLSIVQRAFTGGDGKGELLEVGRLVDSSGWRLERQLRSQGFLRPATESEIAAQKKAPKSAAASDANPQTETAKAETPKAAAAKKKPAAAKPASAGARKAAKKPAARA